jgi:predicted nucleic acid-binding protein
MKAVFADAFYFVALLNRADQYHARVAGFALQFHDAIITTEWVLMEVADALAESASRRSVVPFFGDLARDPKVKIIPAGHDSFQRGLEMYNQRLDKDWPLTDCISFVSMRDEGITDALTGDRHFEQAGFKALFG